MNQIDEIINSLEPATRAFVENVNKQGGTPIYELSPQDARKVLSDLQAAEDASAVLPVLVYYHGGGWVLGDKNTHDRLIREIAVGANVAVIFVNFTPSPEAQYPVPIEEAYAATKYIAENGKDHNLDTSKLIVAGDSVGANMAAAVLLLAKGRGGLSGNVLSCYGCEFRYSFVSAVCNRSLAYP